MCLDGLLSRFDAYADPGEALEAAGLSEFARSLLARPVPGSYDLLSLHNYGAEAAEQLREIVRAWPALTDERRKFTLAFVADQEVLARLDRMPSPPGRYEAELKLSPRKEERA